MKGLTLILVFCSCSIFSTFALSGETSGHGSLGPVVKCETMKGEVKYIPVTYCKIFGGVVH